MRKTLSIFLLNGLFSLLFTYSSFAQFKVIGYLPTWVNYPNSINNVDLSKVTHVNIAFANPNGSGNLIPSDGTNANVTTVVNAAHAQSVKVFMSIGGWGAPGATYSTLLGDVTTMNKFVDSIVKYTVVYNLDGIDVDLEGDVLDGTTVTDIQYEDFINKLSAALHVQGKEISAALATWFESDVTNAAASYFDWINIMSYDNAIPPSDPVGPHSPYSLAVSDFEFWNGTKGVSGSKLNIGLPFYGYGWGTYASPGDNEITYCSIVTSYAGAENSDQVGSGNNVIYYNGIPTIQQKTTYALQNAGGVMIWQLTEDCSSSNSKSLLSAIDQTIHSVSAISNGSGIVNVQLNATPNPVTDYLNVQLHLPNENKGSLAICDMYGSVLYWIAQGTLEKDAVYNVPVSSLNSGVYILKLDMNTSTIIQKVVK